MQQHFTPTQKLPSECSPKSREDILDWLMLYRSRRVGPATFIRLVRAHGGVRGALDALPSVAAEYGVKDYTPCSREHALAELKRGGEYGAKLLFLGDESYPNKLALISDAPPLLWSCGDITLINKPTIAIIGARNSSSVGRRMATRLAKELGEAGFVIVSGLARGIDAAAHTAALESGTIAVQAGGIDTVYPDENAKLQDRIADVGLRLSEAPIGQTPYARHFPQRNRIVSGLASAVIVVEAAGRSGSLLTAKNALDQGREVLAVPGSPLDARASGCNMLIRDGATLIRNAEDVLELLGPPQVTRIEQESDKSDYHGDPCNEILSLLGATPVSEDILIRQTKIPVDRVMSALTDLEVSQKITRTTGGEITLAI